MNQNYNIQSKENHFLAKIDINENRISTVMYIAEVPFKENQLIIDENLELFIRFISKEAYDEFFKDIHGKMVFSYYYLQPHYKYGKTKIELEYHNRGIHAKLTLPTEILYKNISVQKPVQNNFLSFY